MDMPVVAGMNTSNKAAHPPAMAGAVAGALISIVLWALIGLAIYLIY